MSEASPVQPIDVGTNTGYQKFLAHLLFLPQGKQTNPGYLHNLETNTWNITLGLAAATEARNEHLIILIDKVQTTIVLSQAAMCQ